MILVTGATGNVGAELTRALARSGHPVRALSRDPASAKVPEGVEAVGGDLNEPESLRPALNGVDAVFLLAGYPVPPRLLAAMAQEGVTWVVLLSTGAVVGGHIDNYVVRFNVVSEAAVRDSELAWTVLRPSGFMSNALRWLPQLQAGDQVREPFADVPVAVIDPQDVAEVAVRALTQPGHEGRSYRLTGPEATRPGDRLHILGEILGRPLQLIPQDDDEARQDMTRDMPAPLVDAFFRFSRGGEYDDSQIDDTAAQLLGRALRSFTDWARAHADAFR